MAKPAGGPSLCAGSNFRVDDRAAKSRRAGVQKAGRKIGRNVHAGCDAKCGSARPRGVDFVAKIGRELKAIKKAPNSVHRDH
jgi:hypothetical protein